MVSKGGNCYLEFSHPPGGCTLHIVPCLFVMVLGVMLKYIFNYEDCKASLIGKCIWGTYGMILTGDNRNTGNRISSSSKNYTWTGLGSKSC